jgi:hypothetical protein
MRRTNDYRYPEKQAATGLPLTIILGAVVFLGIYVFAVGAMNTPRSDVRVYLPETAATDALQR